jgi:tetratricopeptide (TPR) repeat protein
MARCCLETGQPQAAIELLAKEQHRDDESLLVLASGYLQLHRYQEAAGHLTELCQRQPDEARLATNLAFCRWRLGRAAFENELWNDAHREFLAAFETLKDRQRQTAAALLAWALEAAFRDVLAVLRNASAARDETSRVVDACRFGCQQAGRELRWQLVAGIATARAGEFAASVAHFQEACRLSPRLPAAMLGLALSQHEAGEPAAAAQMLAELLASLGDEDRQPSGEAEVLRVRVSFAQAMVAARAKDWTAAAAALTPLITHSLVQGSNALSTRDLAELAVAYHGAAGNHQEARQLAQLHLPDMRTPSDVLIGVVQADAKDYAGAAATLGRSLRADNNPQVVKLLVSCLLAIAAEAVLRGDFKTANNSIMAALGYEPQNKAAKNLLEALESEGNGQAHRVAIAQELLSPNAKIEGLVQPKGVRVTHTALLAELQPYVAEPPAVSDLHWQPIEMEIHAGAQRLPGSLKIEFDC